MKAFWIARILTLVCCLAFLLAPGSSPAQTRLRDIAQRDAATGWIYFNAGVRMAPETFFLTFQKELGLTALDQLKLVRSWTDDIGMTHHLFHQYHAGIQVENAAMLLHERNGELSAANGHLATGIQMNVQPSVDVDFARQKSLQEVGAKDYAWENEILEAQLRADTHSPDTSWYPQPELLYVRNDRSKQFSLENMALAYRTLIYALEPFDQTDVYVDAHSGRVLYQQSRIISCVPGTGVTNYYGQKNIDLKQISSNFYLLDDCRGLGVNTSRRFSATNFAQVTSPSTAFLAATQNQNSGHWCSETTYDYFFNAHGRNSFDNAGAVMATGVGGFGANAYWFGGYVTILDGDNGVCSNSLATLDVVGHEWTHAVTQFNGTGGLTYSYESGALNESFSDIFGTMVEYYPPGPLGQPGYYGDYFLGDDCWVPDGMVRNMEDPKFKGQPDTYLKAPWYVGTSDNGGVHTNSGVPNHWFYLLAEGSGATDGVNDNGEVFSVSGITRVKAAAIAYHTLTNYLTPTSNFLDARAGSIQCAKLIYGANSNEATQVANAWHAVGVGNDDLMIKDNLADTGAEPSNGVDMFLALDIWVRKTPDQLNTLTGQYQNQYISQDLMATATGANPSHVYVKIRNVGNVASQGGTLKMYWSRASTGLSWPLHWTNSFLCPPDPNNPGTISVCGDQFADYTSGFPVLVDFPIPSIPAGSDYTQHIIWIPPNPTSMPGTGNPTEDTHFCLLARLVRNNDPMHDEQLNVSCNYNTWQNNNVAWKNIQIKHSNGVYLAPPNLDWMCARSRRVIDNAQAIKFRIRDDQQNPFLAKGDILVQLPDSLFTQWILGGVQTTGLEQIGGSQIFKLIAPEAFLNGINLPMGQDYSICLAFNPFQGQPIEVPGNYLATVAQMEKANVDEPYEVVGGEGFELRVNPYPIYLGDDLHICQGDSVELSANLDNWSVNDSTFVYWDDGQTGSTILVAPSTTQTFTVNVTNGDGFVATDQVTVFVQTPVAWYFDGDGDGYGSDQIVLACQQPAGYVDNLLDCNDFSNGIHPGAPEICNGVDDNCNGQIDEGLNFVQSWRDLDADGFGDPAEGLNACIVPQGYVFNNTDCNDQNPEIHPGAMEICNGLDDNCDGQADEDFVCYASSMVFDGLVYHAVSHAGLLLSGDSLIIANTATTADTFSVVVDVGNLVNYTLWYSFSDTTGAVVTQNDLGTVNNGPVQSLGTSTLAQISADEYEATIFIANVDMLQMKVSRNDTLVYEDFILNGEPINYSTTSDDPTQKLPVWDKEIVYVPQPGDRPDLVFVAYKLSSSTAKSALSTPTGNVLWDVIQFYPTAATQDTLSLMAATISATGLSDLVFKRTIAIHADQMLTFCPGDAVNLSATSAAGAGYQWQKDLIDIPGAASADYQAAETGSYRVKVTTEGSTYKSGGLPVTVLSPSECEPSDAVTLAPIPVAPLRISPNPNPGTFSVELSEPATAGMRFRLIGLTGQVWKEQNTQTGERMQTIDASDLPGGLYFLQVVLEEKVVATEKFVKQ